jgi:ABC-2 type transport system permease protein
MRFLKVGSQTVWSPIVNAGLYLLVFGVSLSRILSPYPGVTYLEFLIPGLMALGAFNNALQNSASSIMVSKFNGDLADLKLIPLTSLQIAAAYMLACWVRGMMVAVVIFCVAQVFMLLEAGHFLLPKNWILTLLFVSAGSLFFGSIGVFAGFMAKSFDHISNISAFLILPLIYLGGVFFAIESLPPFWQSLSAFNPLVYLISGLRMALLGVGTMNIGLCIGLSLGFLGLGAGFAWYAVRYGSYQRF